MVELEIDITTSMSLVWHTSLLFISPIKSANGAQLLIITFLFVLLGAAVVPVFLTVIVPLPSMYASL